VKAVILTTVVYSISVRIRRGARVDCRWRTRIRPVWRGGWPRGMVFGGWRGPVLKLHDPVNGTRTSMATTRNRQAAIGTAYEHSVDGRLATSREALRARARNAKGEALADAAEESADEIYESINEIGANLS